MSERKVRLPTFTAHEEKILISSIEKYKYIIENKLSSAHIWKEKMDAWTKILEEFEMQTGSNRTLEKLKLKYDNMKKKAKKEMAKGKKNIYLTSGETTVAKGEWKDTTIELINQLHNDNIENQADDIFHKKTTDLEIKVEFDDSLFYENNQKEISEHVTLMNYDNSTSSSVHNSEDTLKTSAQDDKNLGFLKRPIHRQLKKKKSNPQLAKRMKVISRKKEILLNSQIKFYKNEEKRAQEKHDLDMKKVKLQIHILELEKQKILFN